MTSDLLSMTLLVVFSTFPPGGLPEPRPSPRLMAKPATRAGRLVRTVDEETPRGSPRLRPRLRGAIAAKTAARRYGCRARQQTRPPARSDLPVTAAAATSLPGD